jgi:CubicO group peptidase (beta-lactamase class C family)
VAVEHKGKLVALKAIGHFVYPEAAPQTRPVRDISQLDEDSNLFREVSTSSIFDLASVNKVLATTALAMILHDRGTLDLEEPVVGIIPEIRNDSTGVADPRREKITFRMLLAHSSGLPAYEKLFLKVRSRDELLRAVFSMPLTADPGSRAEYSDIGFITLGVALERIAGESMDVFCIREIFGPLAMTKATFNPPASWKEKIVPTADERPDPSGSSGVRSTFRNRIIQGEVQDENAFILGGVAGHAGLFSTAEDVARFAHAMLDRGNPIVRPETVALFTRRETPPAGTSRALGWDTPSSPSQSGRHFGPASFGHLGYTGTSLWIDTDRQLSITMLTNRTWPDCSNQTIKQVRPRFHDAVIESLDR